MRSTLMSLFDIPILEIKAPTVPKGKGFHPGGKDKEDIVCPYCGSIDGSIMTSGYIHTQKKQPIEKRERFK